MKKYSLSAILIAAGFLILAPGCSKNNLGIEEDPTAGLQQLASGYAIGAAAKLEIYGKGALSAGYVPLFLAIYVPLPTNVSKTLSYN